MRKISNVIAGKCPCCHKGDVFEKTTARNIFKIPKMRNNCNSCGYAFTREPGFFFGAMYVSYGLVVAEMLSVAVTAKFIFGIDNLPTFIAMATVALLLSKINFRLSRLIWMYMFTKKTQCQSFDSSNN